MRTVRAHGIPLADFCQVVRYLRVDIPLWKLIWRGFLTAVGCLITIAGLMSLSEIPEWVDKWGVILQEMEPANIKFIAVAILALIAIAANVPWLFLLLNQKKRKGYREKDDNSKHQSEQQQDACVETYGPEDYKEMADSHALQMVRRRLYIMASRTHLQDWKTKTKYELRALVRSDISSDYEKCLRAKDPEIAASRFLSALAASLRVSDLRPESTSDPPHDSSE